MFYILTMAIVDEVRAGASWLIQTGAGLKVVRDLLGHADLATTDKCAHLEQGAQARAVQAALAGFVSGLGANKAQNAETTKRRAR